MVPVSVFDATTAVTADVTVYAKWTINTFTLTYTAGAHGSVTGTSPQTVDYNTSGSEVTAVADANYYFVSWSDGVLTAARTDANVQADKSVTASFALPVMGGSVSIDGTTKFGSTLTANLSSLTYTPTISPDVPTYQWSAGVHQSGEQQHQHIL